MGGIWRGDRAAIVGLVSCWHFDARSMALRDAQKVKLPSESYADDQSILVTRFVEIEGYEAED